MTIVARLRAWLDRKVEEQVRRDRDERVEACREDVRLMAIEMRIVKRVAQEKIAR